MNEPSAARASEVVGLREILSDAIRYWEWRRWVYNLALVVVVVITFLLGAPASWKSLTPQTGIWLFIQAVLANIAYCAAYPVDIAVQFSSLRQSWRARRWWLLTIGTLFGCALAHLIAVGMFAAGAMD